MLSLLAELESDRQVIRTTALSRAKALSIEEQQELVITLLSKETWYSKQSALLVACSCCQGPSFLSEVKSAAIEMMSFKEVRVRLAAAECLGAIAVLDMNVFDAVFEVLIKEVDIHRNGDEAQMHDTEGWKALESSFICLQNVLSSAVKFHPREIAERVDVVVIDALLGVLDHTNRFVRETAYFNLNEICRVGSSCDSLVARRYLLVKCLAKGLGDNWSQVRFSASVATRGFLESFQEEKLVAQLVPAMCLNRYYIAEGVRVYSIESWKRLVGPNGGRAMVIKHIDSVVDYYLVQAAADNHAVREAVCYCIGELASKVDRDPVRPHVDALLASLVDAFKDQSWPVRDAAATALGDFVAGFPVESQPRMNEVWDLWVAHLSDNIASVREDTAVAMGKVCNALRGHIKERVFCVIDKLLPMALTQSEDSSRFEGLEKASTFGVCENQQVYSCGSLAPKLKRGAGCMDHGFERPRQPWESSDGCIYLLRELTNLWPEEIVSRIPVLAQLASLTHFTHHPYLRQTIWKQVPAIARSLDEKSLACLAPLYIPMLGCAQSSHRLAAETAIDCVELLANIVGPRIFRARVLDEDHHLAESLDGIIN